MLPSQDQRYEFKNLSMNTIRRKERKSEYVRQHSDATHQGSLKKKGTNELKHGSWLQFVLAWKRFTQFTLVNVLHTQPQYSQTRSSH